ncbi:MAG TPA: DUF2378 family protein [Polyangiales bacterium]|nr:DUF2378 family protein [Polyangiales bacterium]
MSESPPAPDARTSKVPSSPTDVTVKGFYLSALIRELASHGHHLTSRTSYRDFANYPLAQAKELVDDAAQRLYPHERKNEGVRRVGWIIYPTLLNTMVGRVIFGSLGDDLPAVLRIAGRGFEVSLTRGSYEPVKIGARDACVRVRDFPLYPDTFLLGVFEGVLARYGFDEHKVVARKLSATDVDFYLEW